MLIMAIASMWASMTAWFTPSVLFCATNLIIATIFIASNNQTKHHDHDHDHDNHLHQDSNININIPPTRISRVSSFILDRARSFKLPSYSTTESQYQHPSEEPKTPTYSSTSRLAQSIHQPSNELYTPEPETQPLSQPGHSPSLFQRVKSIKFSSDDNNNINPPGELTRPPSFLDRVRSFRISSGSTHPENLDPDPEHHVVRSKSENTTTVRNKNNKKKKLKVEMKKSRSEMKMVASYDDDEDVDARRPATARVRGSNDVEEEVDARADDFISRFKQQLKLQRIESLVRNNQMLNRSS